MARGTLTRIMLTSLLICLLTFTFRIQQARASGAVYIMPDGSVDPPISAIHREGDVYYFVDDLYDSAIIVLRNGITIDGNGHTLEGYSGVEYGAGLGIYLKQVGNVTIRNLEITNCYYCAIRMAAGFRNKIYKNRIINNTRGIDFHGSSSENEIYENHLTNNNYSMWLCWTSDNAIYHNNIVGGVVLSENYPNVLDNGYPSGGNYWSDYDGVDIKKGPNQDQFGSDGIGDTPYIIDENNQDRYPLMNLYGTPPPSTHTLTIEAAADGITYPAPGTYTYAEGQNVSAKAAPYTGYMLDHWELDGADVGTANPINITMKSSHTLSVFFTRACTLMIVTTMGGTADPTPGIYTHVVGTLVSVTAVPDAGYHFSYWEFDGLNYSVNPIEVTMNTDHMLKAVFAHIEYALTIAATVGGTTNPPPDTYVKFAETSVDVTALPDSGYYLDHWELDGVNIGISNTVNVMMDMNHTVHAVFEQLSAGHDVAVKRITSKTVVGQGYPLTVKVTATNVGSYTETFNVTVYANATVINTKANVTLTSAQSITITFTWNTTGFAKGNYTLNAYANPVPNETDLLDNNLTGGWVIVAMPGDLTGGGLDISDFIPDGLVDGSDLIVVSRCFGSWFGAPSPLIWNPNCDIDNNDIIDGSDIIIVARHYGEEDT